MRIGEPVDEEQIEFERRKHLLRLKGLYRSYVDGTFELIFRSSQDGALLFGNKLFINTFGFKSYGDARGYSMAQLFCDPEEYLRTVSKLLKDRRCESCLINFKRLNGQTVIGLVNAQIQLNERNEEVINWVVLDISERVEFERNLEAKNLQLAKINSQMEKFLYSTSHDLRSPLTSIMGMVNLMRLEIQDPKSLDYIDKIEVMAMRLDKIIHDIINFSRTTYQNIHSERIEFEPLIWKLVNRHREHDDLARLRTEVTVSGTSTFYSDTDRVEIILDNIIRNAIQYTDANKVLPFVHIKVKLMDGSAVLEVHDNGIGIAKQYFDQIFNMFYKATINSKGAGLGLYIAKEAVEQLGGKINVESEVGFGSVFRITIPNSAKGKLINRKHQLRQGLDSHGGA